MSVDLSEFFLIQNLKIPTKNIKQNRALRAFFGHCLLRITIFPFWFWTIFQQKIHWFCEARFGSASFAFDFVASLPNNSGETKKASLHRGNHDTQFDRLNQTNVYAHATVWSLALHRQWTPVILGLPVYRSHNIFLFDLYRGNLSGLPIFRVKIGLLQQDGLEIWSWHSSMSF